MGTIFTLTTDIKTVTSQALDDLMTELGKNCQLIYPPKWAACVNCVFDPIGQKSSNRWVNGGPAPFPEGSVCPVCNGAGQRAEETTETIKMLVRSEPAHFWVKAPPGVNVPAGLIQTKGFFTDMPKVLQAQQMVVQPELQAIIRYRYTLVGEPLDIGNIIQGRYFVAMWQRSG
jgi:hypothetical protein